MGDVWARIAAELSRRPESSGRETAWLAEQLKCRLQVVNNWKERGVPPSRHAAIARVLGWSVDQVVGTQSPGSWPFENITREQFDALTERQKGMVEQALRDAMDAIEAQDPRRKRQGNGV